MNSPKKLSHIFFVALLISAMVVFAWKSSVPRAIVMDKAFNMNQASTFGNKFHIEWNYVYFKLDSSNKHISLRFTALNSKILGAIHVFSTYTPKGTPIVTLQLQADDGSPSHFPSGTVLAQTNITTFPSSNFKWIRVTIPSTSITAGTVYHIVMFSKNSDANNNWDYRMTKPLNEFWINDTPNFRGVLASNQPTPTWVDQVAEPVYVLEYADGKREGNPYSGTYKRPIWGGWKQGENFIVQNETRISALSMRASKQGNPADNVYIVLTTAPDPQRDGNILARGIAATSDKVPSFPTWDWATYTLPSQLTLSPGRYRIYLESPGSTQTDSYLQDQDIGSSGYEDVTYGGYESCYAQQTPEQAATKYWGLERYVDHAFALEIAGLPKVWEKPFKIEPPSNQITTDITVSGVKTTSFVQNINVTIHNGRNTPASGKATVEIFLDTTLKATLESDLAITISAQNSWSKTYNYLPLETGDYKVKVTFLES